MFLLKYSLFNEIRLKLFDFEHTFNECIFVSHAKSIIAEEGELNQQVGYELSLVALFCLLFHLFPATPSMPFHISISLKHFLVSNAHIIIVVCCTSLFKCVSVAMKNHICVVVY